MQSDVSPKDTTYCSQGQVRSCVCNRQVNHSSVLTQCNTCQRTCITLLCTVQVSQVVEFVDPTSILAALLHAAGLRGALGGSLLQLLIAGSLWHCHLGGLMAGVREPRWHALLHHLSLTTQGLVKL